MHAQILHDTWIRKLRPCHFEIINKLKHETVGKQAINSPSHLAMLTAANRIRTKKRGRSKMKGNYKKSSPQSRPSDMTRASFNLHGAVVMTLVQRAKF